MAAQDPATAPQSFLAGLFSFRARMRPGHYFLGVLILLLILCAAFVPFAERNLFPYGGRSHWALPIIILLPFFWIHLAITINRLRDAAMPVWVYLVFLLAPYLIFLAVWSTMVPDYPPVLGVIIEVAALPLFLLLLVVPCFLPGKSQIK
jgi:uncharacterized membrane protein YhaH (DUF805 family)